MQAGISTVNITPPEGSPMACFPVVRGQQPRCARGIHDTLLATALVLCDGQRTIGICSCDLTLIHHMDVEKIRSEVGEEVSDLGDEKLIIAASHTHSGPENTYLFGTEPGDEAVETLNSKIASAVVAAARKLEPVELSAATGRLELSHNRRVTDENGRSRMVREHEAGTTEGPVDPDLQVLCCDATDGRMGILYNWAAHALTLGPKNRLFSADYPGAARRAIQRSYSDSAVLFLNGAAGNIHPRQCMRNDTELTEQVGGRVGKKVLELADKARKVRADKLRFASDTLRFTNRMDPALQVEVELSCLRLGPVIFAFVPGEVFVQFQLEFKNRVEADHVFFAGYTNGWPGYVPTQESYETGGYGVDARQDDPPEFCRTALPPGAGEKILDALVEISNRV